LHWRGVGRNGCGTGSLTPRLWRRRSDAATFSYFSARRWPSNTAAWQVRPATARAAHSRAATLALTRGPATRRSSTVPGLAPSRTATTGRSPSTSGAWLFFTESHRVRSPSTVGAVPRSMPNSVLVATDPAGPSGNVGSAVAGDSKSAAGAALALEDVNF